MAGLFPRSRKGFEEIFIFDLPKQGNPLVFWGNLCHN
jgi:hypothetical protein